TSRLELHSLPELGFRPHLLLQVDQIDRESGMGLGRVRLESHGFFEKGLSLFMPPLARIDQPHQFVGVEASWQLAYHRLKLALGFRVSLGLIIADRILKSAIHVSRSRLACSRRILRDSAYRGKTDYRAEEALHGRVRHRSTTQHDSKANRNQSAFQGTAEGESATPAIISDSEGSTMGA